MSYVNLFVEFPINVTAKFLFYLNKNELLTFKKQIFEFFFFSVNTGKT